MSKILKFSASWCQPCKMLSKRIEGEDLGAPVQEVDIDENTDLATKYAIRGVPTLVLVDDQDQEVGRLSGVHSAADIKRHLGL